MRRTLFCLLLLSLAVERTPLATTFKLPRLNGKWQHVESEHFDLYSDAGPSEVLRDSERLETFRSVVASLLEHEERSGVRVRVFSFTDRRDVQPYLDLLFGLDDSDATGAFAGQRDGGVAFVDRRGTDHTDEHELVHAILSPGGELPLWLHEGLAEYFSHYHVGEHRLFFGEIIKSRVASLRGRSGVPIDELFGVRGEAELYRSQKQRPLFYAQAWATVHRLMSQDDSLAKMRVLVATIRSGATSAAAVQKAFGVSAEALERDVARYGGVITPPPHSMNVPAVRLSNGKVAELSRAAVLAELGDAMRLARPTDDEIAAIHYDTAVRLEPDLPRAIAGAALMNWSKDVTAATRQLERAVALAPNDPAIALRYGRFLLARAIGPLPTYHPLPHQIGLLREARVHLARARSLEPQNMLANGSYAMTFLAEERGLDEAVALLERARAALPEHIEYAAALLVLRYRKGEEAAAARLFGELDAMADPQAQLAARAVRVDVLVTRANDLAKQGDHAAAAKLVRELIAATPEGDMRKQLEAEAAKLESIASANAEVAEFNEAVRQYNAKQFSAAAKTLDALLAHAKDPDIIDNARSLRENLRRK